MDCLNLVAYQITFSTAIWWHITKRRVWTSNFSWPTLNLCRHIPRRKLELRFLFFLVIFFNRIVTNWLQVVCKRLMNLMLERGAYAGILISVMSAQPDIGLKHITVPMTKNTFFLFHTFKMVCDRYIIKVEVVLLMDDNKINNSKNTFFFMILKWFVIST